MLPTNIIAKFRGSLLACTALLGMSSVTIAGDAPSVLDIQHWETEQGAQVYFYPTSNLPMVDIRVSFDAGSARDPEALEGTAALVSAMLTEGSDGQSASTMAYRFAELGAEISTGVGSENASVRLRSLSQSQYLNPAVSLFNKTLSAPNFAADTFEREQRQQLQSISARQQSPRALAIDALREVMFAGHPYAHPTTGTVESVERITLEDVQDFYQRYYVAANADVVIVGDVDRNQAEALADSVLAGLPAGQAAPALPEVSGLAESLVKHVPFPSEQSTVFVAYNGIARQHEDYFPLYVGNHIFGGGGFASRLNAELRQKRGLAYSVSSFLMPMRAGGVYAMSIQTRNDAVKEAVALMQTQLQAFIDQGPEAEELKDAIANITGGFPLRLDSNSKITGQIGALAFYGLPLDYFDQYVDHIRAVDSTAIQAAFAKHIDLDEVAVIVVGPEAPEQP